MSGKIASRIDNNCKNQIIFKIVGLYCFQLFIVIIFSGSAYRHWIMYINPMFRLIDYYMGMMIAKIILDKDNSKNSIATKYGSIFEFIAIIVFLVIYLNARYIKQEFRGDIYYSPILMIIVYIFAMQNGCISKMLGNNFFVNLASLSFEFYMVHQLVIKLSIIYLKKMPIICVIVAFCSSLVIARILKKFRNYVNI